MLFKDYFVLIFFIVVLICFLINLFIDGVPGIIVFAIFFGVGTGVSFLIINIFRFEDATWETIITLCICNLPLLIWQSYETFLKYKNEQIKETAKKELIILNEKLNDVEIKMKENKTILNFISLIRNCEWDIKVFENNKILKKQIELLDLENDIKEKIKIISSKIH